MLHLTLAIGQSWDELSALVPDLLRMLSPEFDRNAVLFDFPTGETRAFE